MPMRLLPAVAALVAAAAFPAAAHEVNVNSRSGREVHDDGSACFTIEMKGPIAGVATVVGLVRTDKPMLSLTDRGAIHQGPTNYYADQRTFLSLYDRELVCLAGVGRPIVGGSAVLTVVAHGTASELVIVLRCTFSRSGPNCA